MYSMSFTKKGPGRTAKSGYRRLSAAQRACKSWCTTNKAFMRWTPVESKKVIQARIRRTKRESEKAKQKASKNKDNKDVEDEV